MKIFASAHFVPNQGGSKKYNHFGLFFALLAAFALIMILAGSANAAGGSYSLNWGAADPAPNQGPHSPTYLKQPPSLLACPTPSGESGRANDPLANAVAYDTTPPPAYDAVQSLAPETMSLGQVVPFELVIIVNGSTAPENGVIQFQADWLAKTTSGAIFGFDPAWSVYCAFVDFGDAGNIDTGTAAKVDTFSGTTLDVGGSNERIQGTIKVSGLDNGDRIIVEIWVVLKSTIPAGSTGNVQTSLGDAQTCTNPGCTTGATINTGNQTVPLLRVQEFFSSDVDVSIIKTDSPDPVTMGNLLTYSINVTNSSTTTIANAVVVTDNLDPNTTFVSGSWPLSGGIPAGNCTHLAGTVTCSIGGLAQSQTLIITIVVRVKYSAPNNDPTNLAEAGVAGTICPNPTSTTYPADLCNRVSVTTISDDTNPANNNYAQPTNVLPLALITVHKFQFVGGQFSLLDDWCFTINPNPNGVGPLCIEDAAAGITFFGLPTGNYIIDEVPQPGWELLEIRNTSLSCSRDGLLARAAAIVSASGSTVVDASCNFVNRSTATSVILSSFKGVARVKNIKLKWRTGTELDVLGFNVYRSSTKKGTFTRLNDALIPAKTPGQLSGNKYVFLDSTAEAGTKYFYKLELLDTSGATLEWSDIVKVRKPPSQ